MVHCTDWMVSAFTCIPSLVVQPCLWHVSYCELWWRPGNEATSTPTNFRLFLCEQRLYKLLVQQISIHSENILKENEGELLLVLILLLTIQAKLVNEHMGNHIHCTCTSYSCTLVGTDNNACAHNIYPCGLIALKIIYWTIYLPKFPILPWSKQPVIL